MRTADLHAVETEHVMVGGLPIRVLMAGSGDPLVLLHGVGDSAIDWQWVLPELAHTYRVYAPDIVGFGASLGSPPDASLEALVNVVAAFLEHLDLEQVTLVGNSLGGMLAVQVALTRPQRVRSVVLVDSAGLGRAINPGFLPLVLPGYGDMAIAWCKNSWGAMQRALWRGSILFANPARIPPDWLSEQYRLAQQPGFLEASLAALRAHIGPQGQRVMVLDELAYLAVPTLIVWGQHDAVFPRVQAETASPYLQHGHLTIIDDCGHLPHIEQPEQFLKALQEFLALS